MANSLPRGRRSLGNQSSAGCSSYCGLGTRWRGSRTGCPAFLSKFIVTVIKEQLKELLEAEAEKLTQAARHERNKQRQGYRSGHYNRSLTITSGDVILKVYLCVGQGKGI